MDCIYVAARSAAAAAARGGDESTGHDDPRLPPLRLGASHADPGGAALVASPASSSSSDSDAFLSTTSTPSGTATQKFSSPNVSDDPILRELLLW